jgi:hypothetical protein
MGVSVRVSVIVVVMMAAAAQAGAQLPGGESKQQAAGEPVDPARGAEVEVFLGGEEQQHDGDAADQVADADHHRGEHAGAPVGWAGQRPGGGDRPAMAGLDAVQQAEAGGAEV